MIENLYTLLGTTRTSFLRTFPCMLSLQQRCRGKNPRPAKQIDWIVDTTLIWTNFTLRFRSEWVDRFNMTLSTTHDTEGRQVLEERAKQRVIRVVS